MKRKNSILVLLVSVLFADCSSNNFDGLSVSNVSNSDCLQFSRTRTDESSEDSYRTKLILTREGNNIVGELRNYHVECHHHDLYVHCKQDGPELTLTVKEESPEDGVRANCSCMVNIYFTLQDLEGDLFHVYLGKRDFGNVSFKEGNVVELTEIEH